MALEHLEDRTYSAGEVSALLGRNRSRIHQLSRRFGIGHDVPLTPAFKIKHFSKNDILWFAKWFEENGKPHTEKGRSIDQQWKPLPKEPGNSDDQS